MRGDWDNLHTVMMLVRTGSLNAAAEALGVSYTTVSRRIAAAEDSFGTQLFERTQTGYVATEAGLEAARYATEMELTEAALRRNLDGRDNELRGRFTITAPELLLHHHMAPVVEKFLQHHPRIDLNVRASNDLLDLGRRQADLAIRISSNPGDDLVGRRLVEQETASFARSDLVEAMTRDPSAPVHWLGFDFWTSTPRNTRPEYTDQRILLRYNDMIALLGAVRAGLGVARMPIFVGNAYPELVRAPILPPQPYTDILVLTHRDLKDAAKVRAFKDVLIPHFREIQSQFVTGEI
ncbi:hypothetical protein ACMU_03220 [Actibacterium mucosum KCTC 23349]|uniref:HTH lysR-type domain-containing protein n=1 Tax=Actibacterium mucosum KCTC 23349 TaxID=1454373 RepID=A0A037ZRQ0_9RHOB|nr:LysR family transcriptional regulator [Actibacterium mucosum]KAJ57532.1 hypothetical protein ACMU_03220 [Actibacterium mucosum KCTC 23349]